MSILMRHWHQWHHHNKTAFEFGRSFLGVLKMDLKLFLCHDHISYKFLQCVNVYSTMQYALKIGLCILGDIIFPLFSCYENVI